MKRKPDPMSFDLFNQPVQKRDRVARMPAYQLSSETSRMAAEKIRPKINEMHRTILGELMKADPKYGLTRKELERRTGIITATLCARLNELEEGVTGSDGVWRKRIRKLYKYDAKKGQSVVQKREGCSCYGLFTNEAAA